MVVESGISKQTASFKLKTPEFSLLKVTKVFSFSNIPETLFLDGITMPLGFFDPVYTRIRYRETVSDVEILFTIHQTEDDAIFDEDQIGFSFLTITKDPFLFPFSGELTLMNGLVDPDVEGTKANIRLSSIAGINKFAVFKCEPGFI